jgi:hypothetical protein
MAARAARKSAFDTEKARQYLSRKIVFHMIRYKPAFVGDRERADIPADRNIAMS